MFSRDNRMDYQLFFRSRGAVRPLGWSGLTVVVWLSNALLLLSLWRWQAAARFAWMESELINALRIGLVLLTAVIGKLLSPGALKLLPKPVRRATSLFSPLVAILLLIPSMISTNYTKSRSHTVAYWLILVLLFLAVLLLTVSRLRFRRIIKLIQDSTGLESSRQVFWHRLVLNLCMFAELVMLVLIYDNFWYRVAMVAFQLLALLSVSWGNLQVPTAAGRIMLALWRLLPHNYRTYSGSGERPAPESMVNLVPSLDIFYGTVLAQGAFYIVACLLEVFSIIPRRSLARHGGFAGHRGVDSVNLYYAYALQKWMESDVLAVKHVSLVSFAMDSINSDSPNLQLHGVWMMYSLLQKEPTRTELLSKIDASTNATARLINMLKWEDTTIRLFAAKVTAVLAKSLLVVTTPGAVEVVSALLNGYCEKPEGGNLLFCFTDDDEQEMNRQDLLITVDATSRIHEERHQLITLEVDDNPAQHINMRQVAIIHDDEQNSRVLIRWWRRISEFWSVPHEKPLTEQDILPVLGMSIIGSLANYDLSNCMKISKVEDLIPKIIQFTFYTNSGMQNTSKVQQKILMGASLKLLGRLSSIDGTIGTKLRHMIAEHPVLLRNLAAILDDRFSSRCVKRLATGILRNLATDGNMREEIGRIKVVVRGMIDAFLSRATDTSINTDQHLQKVAGQALAILTMDSAHNCVAILMEPENVIGELTRMVCENRHIYVAASLLQNLLLHIQPKLTNSSLRELLCSTLPKVFGNIMHAEEEDLEILIGLSSKICKVIPEDFIRELENSRMKETFVKRLVDTLKANMYPDIPCPRMRRVTIEQAIYLMKYSSHYASFFDQYGMMEALLMVEQTPSSVERYMFFFKDARLMEHKEPLANLVATAKELMCRQWLRGIK